MVKIVNEMAMGRSEAITTCLGRGRQFIKHFIKIINDIRTDSSDYVHHINEMQVWWDDVRDITLKTKNRKITNVNLVDWFFTAGGTVEDRIKDEELVEIYNDFITVLLSNRDQELKLVIEELSLKYHLK